MGLNNRKETYFIKYDGESCGHNFNNGNKIYESKLSKVSFKLNFASLVLLLIGIFPLVFLGYVTSENGVLNTYIKAAFNGEIFCLLTIIGTMVSLICLTIQLYFHIIKSENIKLMLVVDIIAILFTSVSVVFGFKSISSSFYSLRYSDIFNIGIIVFSILMSICLLLLIIHLVLEIILTVKYKNILGIKGNSNRPLSLAILSCLLLFVFGGLAAKEAIITEEFKCYLTYSENETYATLYAYSGDNKNIVIPDTYIGYKIRSIDVMAFCFNKNIISVVIPESVTSIGDYAFHWCTSLKEILIPNSVTSIGKFAFATCTSLTNIIIPESVTSIGDHAFSGCSMTSIIIPESVTSIGFAAFSYCSSLTNIVIPEGITSIAAAFIAGCTSLTSVIIPESVTSIGYSAFSECSSLTSIIIPKSVTRIGFGAFSDCSSLTNIVIPEGITSIGDYAFESCSSLRSIIIPESVTNIGSLAFNGCSNLALYSEATYPSWHINSDDISIYRAGEWEYDNNGNPVPLG